MNEFLFPYQQEAVDKTIKSFRTYKACYNGSDMGVGKSVMTCGTLNRLRSVTTMDQNILIVCPSVMRDTWSKELRKFTNITDIAIMYKGSDIPLKLQSNRVYIISYDLISREDNLKVFLQHPWFLMIADEAHYLKSMSTNRTTAITALSKNARYKLFLSGTPFINCSIDIFPVAQMCAPHEFSDFNKFAEQYAYKQIVSFRTKFGVKHTVKYSKVKNTAELSKKLRDSFFIRYRRDEVLKNLPECTETVIWLGKECGIKASESEIAEVEASIKEGKQTGEAISKLRKEIGLKKIKSIADYVEDLLDTESSVILFAHHKEVVEKYMDALKKHKPFMITGSVSGINRAKAIEGFQAGDSRLIIMNIAAGGVGVTLTKAKHVVFAEFPWVYSEYAQAIGRAHRNGQLSNVLVHNFMVEGSIDERIVNTVRGKKQMHVDLIDKK